MIGNALSTLAHNIHNQNPYDIRMAEEEIKSRRIPLKVQAQAQTHEEAHTRVLFRHISTGMVCIY